MPVSTNDAIDKYRPLRDQQSPSARIYSIKLRTAAFIAIFFLASSVRQVGRILPFIPAEAIKAGLALGDAQIGLAAIIAAAV